MNTYAMFLQMYCILRLNVQHTSGKGYHETQSTKGDGEIALADECKSLEALLLTVLQV